MSGKKSGYGPQSSGDSNPGSLWLTDGIENAVCGGEKEARGTALFFSQDVYFESILKAVCF